MKANDYQKRAARTIPPVHRNSPVFVTRWKEGRLLNAALGLAGEAGEVAELVKKGMFHGHKLNPSDLGEELGDLLWYVAMMCTVLGIDLETVMQANLDKLRKRYPDGFTPEASRRRGE